MPEGWVWCRLQTICEKEIKRGKAPKYVEKSGTLVFAQKCNTKKGKINITLAQYLDESTLHKYSPDLFTRYNDIIINSTGTGTLGRIGIFEESDDLIKLPIVPDSHITTVRAFSINVAKYVYLFLKANQPYFEDSGEGSTNQKELRPEVIKTFLIAIPPYKEQEKIVEKFEAVCTIIDLLDAYTEDYNQAIKSIKSKILDLAIRGKLVPQNPDDEPASVLLERIKAEKEELIRQGKIKRDKKESVIFKGEDNSYYLNDGSGDINITNDLPFDIPSSWRWAQIKDVFIVNPRNKLDDELDVSFVPMPLIDDGYSGKHTAEVRKWKDIKTGFTHFSEGDVGVAKISPCFENLKSTVFENLSNGYGAGTTELYILRPYKDTILAHYLLMYIKSDYFIRNGKQTCTGDVGQQRVRKDYVESAYFPIPPLNEQHRIVEAIETAFSQLDAIAESLN